MFFFQLKSTSGITPKPKSKRWLGAFQRVAIGKRGNRRFGLCHRGGDPMGKNGWPKTVAKKNQWVEEWGLTPAVQKRLKVARS